MTTTYTYSTLRFTAEFDEPLDMPAEYLLESWRDHPAALAVIRAATKGRSGSFLTPMGLVIVRPVA